MSTDHFDSTFQAAADTNGVALAAQRVRERRSERTSAGLCTVDPMAAIWQRHHLSALAAASLFAVAASSLGSGWVASHSVRAAINGSIPLFRHHDASSPQRWIS